MCIKTISCSILLFVVSWLGASTCGAVTISVDQSKTYQKIDGFGGYGGIDALWNQPKSLYTDAFLNLLIDTMGATIVRIEFNPSIFPEFSNAAGGTSEYSLEIPYAKALLAKAKRLNEPIKIYANTATPPSEFKTNNSNIGGGFILADSSLFADYLIRILQKYKTDVGQDLYGFSFQNEPSLSVWYNSCSWNMYMENTSPQDYVLMMACLGTKMTALKMPVKLIYTDDVGGNARQTICRVTQRVAVRSPATDSIASIMAMHYTAGNTPNDIVINYRAMGNLAMVYPNICPACSQSGGGGYMWDQSLCTTCNGTGIAPGKTAPAIKKKFMWNTEFGTGSDSWSGGAWDNAINSYNMLNGNFSAIVYIYYHTSTVNDESLMPSGTPKRGPKAYVFQMFARYIRPNAVRVECTSSDASVKCLAFKHAAQQTSTVLLINTNATSSQTVTVSGAGLPASFDVYQSSATQNCVKIGTSQPGANVTLTPKSITVLYNTPAPIAVRHGTIYQSRPVTTTNDTKVSVYGIDGKVTGISSVGQLKSFRHEKHVYIVKQEGFSPRVMSIIK
jgi:glucuronoarabinoxylan endo-1,4-beta-xylanase